jgi:adenylate cyclase class 2
MLWDVAPRAETESEIKIPVTDIDHVRQRLQDGDWRLHRALHREVNVLFDTPDGDLRRGDAALRLRRAGTGWTLTYKGRAEYAGGVKSREELEVEIDDGAVLAAILLRLGLSPARRYEKDRETWTRNGVLAALDHTPIGDFVELEGPAERLADTAASLGLDTDRAVERSYPALWDEYRRRHADRELPEHMVFGGP